MNLKTETIPIYWVFLDFLTHTRYFILYELSIKKGDMNEKQNN